MERREFIRGALAATSALAIGASAPPAAAEEKAEKPRAGWRKGLVFGMLPGKLSIHDRLALARDAGFEGVEAHTEDDPKRVEEMRAASERTGVAVHSVMNSAHWGDPLSSPDGAVVDRSVKGMETSLRNAKALGATTVLLVPAVVSKEVRYADAYARSQKVIRERLLPLAQELGVTIAVENVWNHFLLSPIEFARYVDEFQHPRLQAYFDVGNVNIWGYPQDWIRTLAKRVAKVHVKGFDARDYQRYRFVELREGSIEWPEVMKAFDEVGYHGWISAELGGKGSLEELKKVSADLDLIFAGK